MNCWWETANLLIGPKIFDPENSYVGCRSELFYSLQCLRDDKNDKSGSQGDDDDAAHYQLQQHPTIKLEINLKHKF